MCECPRNINSIRPRINPSQFGKSGLSLTGRAGLRQLLLDVEQGDIDFTAVLVYDVSRWGRFQNPDQGASYEYSLTTANIMIHYCAEQFQNDGSLSSALLKTLKRGMAGEYSRELSVKVWAGQRRLIELGFRQGGPAGYGLRRHLLDQNRNFKQPLQTGERKSLQTDRVVLVPGPENEVQIVRRIYEWFVQDGRTEAEIATLLNANGVMWEPNRAWTRGIVHQILTNHKYVGSNVFNRRSHKLKIKRVKNPPESWIFKPNAFQPLIGWDQFEAAQEIISARHNHLSNEELLSHLKVLLEKKGYLSGILIDETEGMPSSSRFSSRFGSLIRAYSLVGWVPGRDYSFIEINREIRRQHRALVTSVITDLNGLGADVHCDDQTDLLTINHEYTTSLVLARCRTTSAGNRRWLIRFDSILKPDVTVAARLTPGNDSILDYYILPSVSEIGSLLRLTEGNPLPVEVYRFNNLDFFLEAAKRSRIESVA
jgi:DNA invertase Pin-like site-specific DNA recombinase